MLSNKNKKYKSGTLSLELESSIHSSLLRAARGNLFLKRNRTPLNYICRYFS